MCSPTNRLVTAFVTSLLAVTLVSCDKQQDTVKSSVEEIVPVNFYLPLYTKASTLVCPLSALFDRREGYGLQAALKAHMSVFGREEAIAKSGCYEWREGLPILLTEKAKAEATELNNKKLCGMVDFSEGLILSCDLKNTPNAASNNGVQEKAEKITQKSEVALPAAKLDSLTDKCRDEFIAAFKSLPKSTDYPAAVYTGPHHEAVITKENQAFHTRLRELVRTPVNFAGHYAMTWVGCGTSCIFPMIIDVKSGETIKGELPPMLTDCNEGREREIFAYPNSRLLIVTGANAEESKDTCFIRYYKEENGRLTKFKTIPIGGQCAKP